MNEINAPAVVEEVQSSTIARVLRSQLEARPWPDETWVDLELEESERERAHVDADTSMSTRALKHTATHAWSEQPFEPDSQRGDSSGRPGWGGSLAVQEPNQGTFLYPQAVKVTSLNSGIPFEVAEGEAHKTIQVLVTGDQVPLSDVQVRCFLGGGRYARGFTNQLGLCILRIPISSPANVGVMAMPQSKYWSKLASVPVADELNVAFHLDLELLSPIWLSQFRDYFDLSPSSSGKGVRVAVVDTGVDGSHELLTVAKGASLVRDDPDPGDFRDTLGHGTLVAGIIGATGDGATRPRGLAPGAEIFAYRVVAFGAQKAEEATVAAAIYRAVDDGCHLINISLGSSQPMTAVKDAILFAKERGVVCIASAGNGSKQTLSYPARYDDVLAVTAMSRLDSYPIDSEGAIYNSSIIGENELDSMASFSNVGATVDLCAPGVGVVSTWLGGEAAVMCGTSFAAPVVTALIARVLSAQTSVPILSMQGGLARYEAIRSLALQTAREFGFTPLREGAGCLSLT